MKKQDSTRQVSSEETLFRYQAVSQILIREKIGESRITAIDHVAGNLPFAPGQKARKPSRRTLYRWLAAFEKHGFAGLVPSARPKAQDSKILPQPVLDFFQEQKQDDPSASVPELIRRAKERGLISPEQTLNRSTVWRNLKARGIQTSRCRPGIDHDCRPFAFPHRMDMVLCDGKHFRAGPGRLRRVALFFLDDATRMILGVIVGTSENKALFLKGLWETILAYGLMNSVYVDRGSGFTARDNIEVMRQLGLLFIHGSPNYPQARGKIEKFNRTVQEHLLRHLDNNPEIDPSCEALTLRLRHYAFERYNHVPHEALDLTPPWTCFRDDQKPLSFPDGRQGLREKFVLHKQRRVSNHNLVRIDKVPYEVVRGYAGSNITVYQNLLEGDVAMLHQGRLLTLAPADLEDNARQKRGASQPKQSGRPLPKSSAQLSFEKAYRPLVDRHGNCMLPPNKEES